MEGNYTNQPEYITANIGESSNLSNKDIDYLFLNKLSLLENNTQSIIAFSDKLIQYLLKNTIDYTEDNYFNLVDIKTKLNLDDNYSEYTIDDRKSVLSKFVNITEANKKLYELNRNDSLGFIDRDIEYIANNIVDKKIYLNPSELKYNNKPDILILPYIPLLYIESTGTQWIDTGTYAKDITDVYIKASITDVIKDAQYILGTRNTTNSAIGYAVYFPDTRGGLTYYPATWPDNDVATSISNNQIFEIKSKISSNAASLTISNIDKDSRILYNFNLNCPGAISLFKLYQPDYPSAISDYPMQGRIYDLILYNGEEIIKHLIPCINKITNAVCMYDLVSKQFFTNKGTGNFIAGPEI